MASQNIVGVIGHRLKVVLYLANIRFLDVIIFVISSAWGGLTIIDQADRRLTEFFDWPSIIAGWLEDVIIQYRDYRQQLVDFLDWAFPSIPSFYTDAFALVFFLMSLSLLSLSLNKAESGRMIIRRARTAFPDYPRFQQSWYGVITLPGIFIAATLFLSPAFYDYGVVCGLTEWGACSFAVLAIVGFNVLFSLPVGYYQRAEQDNEKFRKLDFRLALSSSILYMIYIVVMVFVLRFMMGSNGEIELAGALIRSGLLSLIAFLFTISVNINWRSLPSVILAAITTAVLGWVTALFFG